jgi:predicted site-specific integrase-resolvase
MESHFSITEFASVCGVNRTTVWRWIKAGKVETEQSAGRKLIPKDQSFHRLELTEESTHALTRTTSKFHAEALTRQAAPRKDNERFERDPRLVYKLIKVQQEYQKRITDMVQAITLAAEGTIPSQRTWKALKHNIETLNVLERTLLELITNEMKN